MIDARYKKIKDELISLSQQTSSSIQVESEYWETYHNRRQQELNKLQSSINEALSGMSGI